MTGVSLMLWGMGIVFIFLVMLVFTMLGVSKLALIIDGEQGGESTEVLQISAATYQSPGVRADVVAVISAAVARYRTTRH